MPYEEIKTGRTDGDAVTPYSSIISCCRLNSRGSWAHEHAEYWIFLSSRQIPSRDALSIAFCAENGLLHCTIWRCASQNLIIHLISQFFTKQLAPDSENINDSVTIKFYCLKELVYGKLHIKKYWKII